MAGPNDVECRRHKDMVSIVRKANAGRVPRDYVAFFDFESTGYEPFACAIQVVGFPQDHSDLDAFERNISIDESLMVVGDLSRIDEGVPRFEPSTKQWWLSPQNDAARQYIARFQVATGGQNRSFEQHKATIVDFVAKIRQSYPGLRFATDNPTLDARYFDNILAAADCPLISMGLGPDEWQRVLATDDLREGFRMATGADVPLRLDCPLRKQMSGIPLHVPSGDALCIASELADLLVAKAKAAKKRKAVHEEIKAAANRAAEEMTRVMQKTIDMFQ